MKDKKLMQAMKGNLVHSTAPDHLEIFENMKQGNMIQTYESIVYHMESPRNISIDED